MSKMTDRELLRLRQIRAGQGARTIQGRRILGIREDLNSSKQRSNVRICQQPATQLAPQVDDNVPNGRLRQIRAGQGVKTIQGRRVLGIREDLNSSKQRSNVRICQQPATQLAPQVDDNVPNGRLRQIRAGQGARTIQGRRVLGIREDLNSSKQRSNVRICQQPARNRQAQELVCNAT